MRLRSCVSGATFGAALLLPLSLLACGSVTAPQKQASPTPSASASAEAEVVVDKTAIGVESPEAQPAGLANADELPTETGLRIGALGPHTWIYKKPEREGLAIGKMRPGTSVAMKTGEPIDGPGCKGKWYAIEPRGYICKDNTATLDLSDPWYKVLAFSAPKEGTFPYRYAHSNGSPMYGRVPTQEEWEKAEKGFGKPNTHQTLGPWAQGHEELMVDDPIVATDEVPYFLRDGKRSAPGGTYSLQALVWRKIPAGSMLAYSRAFEANGRVWLLTPDSMIVPADRVSMQRRSTFEGVHFDKSHMELPFAWNRSKAPLPLYKRVGTTGEAGDFVEISDTLAPKTPIEILDTPAVKFDPYEYYELRRQSGIFIRRDTTPKYALDNDVVFTRAASKLPSSVSEDEKWIEAKIVPGTLTAYVGLTPVFATLFSPGKGGPPAPDKNTIEDARHFATTNTGFFPLEWKEHVATMSNEKGVPKVLWFTDVPNQQYLHAPLAMHVSYWHEDFGKRKSAECLNVSPLDGAWLFGWTLPQMPTDWNAIGAGQGNGESTPVFVTAN